MVNVYVTVVNGANSRSRNGDVMDDNCKAIHCGNDTDRARGVTVNECDDGENIVNMDFGEMDDVCNDVNVNVENGVNMDAGVMGDVCTNFDAEKVKWTAGKGNNINAENDVTRSGDAAVDVCSDVNVENDVNRSGGVVLDVCNGVNIKMM